MSSGIGRKHWGEAMSVATSGLSGYGVNSEEPAGLPKEVENGLAQTL